MMADSGNGSQQQGGGKGGQNYPGTGGQNPGQARSPFSWNGASTPSTFDPKDFGTRMFSDLNTAYGQGPKINPVNPFTDFGAETKGLISQGLTDVANMRNGALGDVASGGWLGGNQNPYREAGYQTTRDNILKDVGSGFTASGRFGGGSYIDRAVDQIASSENPQRAQDFENEWSRYMQANAGLQAGNATGLGYSGLLDSKAAEKAAADSTMWDRTNNAPFNHLAQYMGLLRGGDAANETNKPVSFWDILSGIGSTVGSFL